MKTSSDQRIKEYVENGWWGTATLSTLLADAVIQYPGATALVDQPNRTELVYGQPLCLSFTELAHKRDQLASFFLQQGLRQDDIVVVQLPNIAELVLVYLALSHIGVIVSPISMQYSRFELEHLRDELSPSAYLCVDRFNGVDQLTQILGVAAKVPCFFFGAGQYEPAIGIDIFNLPDTDDTLLNQYLANFDDDANNIVSIGWTSGTTGKPKGVPRSHNMWMASNFLTEEAAGFRQGDALLCPFPFINMASIGSILYNFLQFGAKLVLHHPFDFALFLKQIEDESITYTIAPPAVLTRLLKMPEVLDQADLSSLRAIGSGSAPLSPWMVDTFAQDHNIEITNYFGSNEGVGLFSASADVPNPLERAEYFPRFGVEGLNWKAKTHKFCKTRLIDLASGDPITNPDQPGELQVTGAMVFDGYFSRQGDDHQNDNSQAFTTDGYFRTGDLFTLAGEPDDQSAPLPYYKFCGRCKDIIIRGGYNISPEELDNVLEQHPKIQELACFGYPDDELGERVGIVVVPQPEESVKLSDVTDFLAEKGVAKFKWPERMVISEQLPRNSLNKVLRRELIDLLPNANGRQSKIID